MVEEGENEVKSFWGIQTVECYVKGWRVDLDSRHKLVIERLLACEEGVYKAFDRLREDGEMIEGVVGDRLAAKQFVHGIETVLEASSWRVGGRDPHVEESGGYTHRRGLGEAQ
jgi:hypothetical protein